MTHEGHTRIDDQNEQFSPRARTLCESLKRRGRYPRIELCIPERSDACEQMRATFGIPTTVALARRLPLIPLSKWVIKEWLTAFLELIRQGGDRRFE